jgi:uncharacterized protein GlcG (DUF336 family)
MNTSRILIAATLAAAPLLGHAELLQERNIPLSLAQQIAQGAVAACAQKGFNVTATVVDRAGTVRAVLRADNAGPHTLDGSRAKAYTSASMRNTTAAIGENVQKNPAAQFLPAIPGVIVLAGGVPIRAGNEVIGAVGVAGAPAGPSDGDCASAAIEAVKDQLS